MKQKTKNKNIKTQINNTNIKKINDQQKSQKTMKIQANKKTNK